MRGEGIEQKGKRTRGHPTDNSVIVGGRCLRGLNGNGKNTIKMKEETYRKNIVSKYST